MTKKEELKHYFINEGFEKFETELLRQETVFDQKPWNFQKTKTWMMENAVENREN